MRELPWFRIVGLTALAGLIGLVILIVRSGHEVPSGVQPIAWNHQVCAHCQMLVGDPAFAAQLITTDGDVLTFDDPGCALRYLDQRHPEVHELWFHHASQERWLRADEVGFTTGAVTPMGSGLSAVDRDVPGALDLAAARKRLGP